MQFPRRSGDLTIPKGTSEDRSGQHTALDNPDAYVQDSRQRQGPSAVSTWGQSGEARRPSLMSQALSAIQGKNTAPENSVKNMQIHEHCVTPFQVPKDTQLSDLYYGYYGAVLEMVISGASPNDIIDPGRINVDLLFRDRRAEDSHSVSTFSCEWLKTLHDQDFFALMALSVLNTYLVRVGIGYLAQFYSVTNLLKVDAVPNESTICFSAGYDQAVGISAF